PSSLWPDLRQHSHVVHAGDGHVGGVLAQSARRVTERAKAATQAGDARSPRLALVVAKLRRQTAGVGSGRHRRSPCDDDQRPGELPRGAETLAAKVRGAHTPSGRIAGSTKHALFPLSKPRRWGQQKRSWKRGSFESVRVGREPRCPTDGGTDVQGPVIRAVAR